MPLRRTGLAGGVRTLTEIPGRGSSAGRGVGASAGGGGWVFAASHLAAGTIRAGSDPNASQMTSRPNLPGKTKRNHLKDVDPKLATHTPL